MSQEIYAGNNALGTILFTIAVVEIVNHVPILNILTL